MDGLHLRLHGWQIEVLSIDNPWRILYDLCCWKDLFMDGRLITVLLTLSSCAARSCVTKSSCFWNGLML